MHVSTFGQIWESLVGHSSVITAVVISIIEVLSWPRMARRIQKWKVVRGWVSSLPKSCIIWVWCQEWIPVVWPEVLHLKLKWTERCSLLKCWEQRDAESFRDFCDKTLNRLSKVSQQPIEPPSQSPAGKTNSFWPEIETKCKHQPKDILSHISLQPVAWAGIIITICMECHFSN